MTRDEIKDRIRKIASHIWTPERLESALAEIDHYPIGVVVCFEDRYMGVPQGPTFGPEWEAKAQTSGRVSRIGQLTA